MTTRKFLVRVNAEHEIMATDEEDAIQKFWETIINDTQMNAETFISDNLTVEDPKSIRNYDQGFKDGYNDAVKDAENGGDFNKNL